MLDKIYQFPIFVLENDTRHFRVVLGGGAIVRREER